MKKTTRKKIKKIEAVLLSFLVALAGSVNCIGICGSTSQSPEYVIVATANKETSEYDAIFDNSTITMSKSNLPEIILYDNGYYAKARNRATDYDLTIKEELLKIIDEFVNSIDDINQNFLQVLKQLLQNFENFYPSLLLWILLIRTVYRTTYESFMGDHSLLDTHAVL